MGLAITALVALVILVLLVINGHAVEKRWREKWPKISDDEFMKRCPPGTKRDVALKVRRVISEQTGLEYERIYPEQHFVNDLFIG